MGLGGPWGSNPPPHSWGDGPEAENPANRSLRQFGACVGGAGGGGSKTEKTLENLLLTVLLEGSTPSSLPTPTPTAKA